MPGAGGGGKGCSLKLSSGEASLVRRVLWASSARNGGGGGAGRGKRAGGRSSWKRYKTFL